MVGRGGEPVPIDGGPSLVIPLLLLFASERHVNDE